MQPQPRLLGWRNSLGQQHQRWRIVVIVLLALLTATITSLSPLAFPDASLDSSWAQALVDATDKGRVFGRDIVFTFGPLHQAYTSELSRDASVLITARLVFFSLWLAVQICVGFLLGLWTEVAIALAAALIGSYPMVMPDSFFFLYSALGILLPAAVAQHPDQDRRTRALNACLSMCLLIGIALSPLVKLSFLGSASPALFSVLGYQLCHSLGKRSARTWLWLLTLFITPLMSLLIAWKLVANASLGDLVNFFAGPNRFMLAGYTDAMAYAPNKWSLESMPIYFSVFALSVVVEWRILLRNIQSNQLGRLASLFLKLLTLISTVILFWIVFKAFFVRDDSWRVVNARLWSFAFLTILLGITKPAILQHLPLTKREKLLLVAGLPLTLFGLFYYPGIMVDRIVRGTRDTLKILNRNQYQQLLAKRRLALREIRKFNETYDLPPGVTADVIPWDISTLLANGLNYTPRPVPQSYAAFTKELQLMNKQHTLYSPSRADYLIVASKDIDGRLPIGLDSPTLLHLHHSYRVSHRGSMGSLIFKRIDKNPKMSVEPKDLPPKSWPSNAPPCRWFVNRSLAWHSRPGQPWTSEVIPLPQASTSPIIMNLEVTNSLSRKLLAIVYRPFKVTIDYLDVHGNLLERFRIVPMAGLDMIIVPVMKGKNDLAALFLDCPSPTLLASRSSHPNNKVAAIRFSTESFGHPFERFQLRLSGACQDQR
jgi:hypothetical protein